MKIHSFFKTCPNIKTDRLLIRKLCLQDAPDIFEFTSLEETAKGLSWEPHNSIEVTKNFISSLMVKYENNEASQWGIELIPESKVIGIAGFINHYEEHRKGEVAYVLSPLYQGKGFMTEALFAIINYGFKSMSLQRIDAKCEINNFSSERVMQKLGMRLEGCMYNYLIRKGASRHYKFYSIDTNLNEQQ